MPRAILKKYNANRNLSSSYRVIAPRPSYNINQSTNSYRIVPVFGIICEMICYYIL